MHTRTVFLIAALAMAWCTANAWASGGTLDDQRRVQLERGTTEQRSDVLAWLSEHGSQSDTAVVVPRLRDPDGSIRQLAEMTLWSMWLHSGDSDADAWMVEGGHQMAAGDLDSAIATFTRVIERLPDFAEGYNKRATAYYLRGDYNASLGDIAATLKRNAAHFGALSGAGLCHLKMDQPAEALFFFERALGVNPNMDGIKAMVEALRAANPRPRA